MFDPYTNVSGIILGMVIMKVSRLDVYFGSYSLKRHSFGLKFDKSGKKYYLLGIRLCSVVLEVVKNTEHS